MTKFGAQLYTVRADMQTAEGFLESLKKIKDIGYQYVQVSGQGPDVSAEQIADALKQTGMTCACTHDRAFGFDDMLDNIHEVVRRHDMWNCNYIGVGSMPPKYKQSPETVLEFVQKANRLAAELKRHGKTFIYHNHDFEFYRFDNGKRLIDILFENAGDDLQFEMDLYWVQKAGADPVEWINRARGRMDICHIKDMGVNAERENFMVPIGTGNLNWDGIIKAMNDSGVKLTLVEIDKCPKDSFECLKDSYDFLIRKMPAK